MANTVKDTFTGTTGVDLNAHTGELGATWTKHPLETSGSLVVGSDNKVWTNSSTNEALYYSSGVPAGPDYTVQADIYVASLPGTVDDIGLCGRMNTTTENLYMCRVISGNLELYVCIAGTYTRVNYTAYSPSAGANFTMQLTMVGATISASIVGGPSCSVFDTQITAAGRAGIRGSNYVASASTGYHLDNFLSFNNMYWVGGSGAISQPSYMNDQFTGASNANLNTHTADTGQTWTRNSASFSGGNLVLDGSGRIFANNASTLDTVYNSSLVPVQADYVVEIDFVCLSNSNISEIGVIARGTNTSSFNFYLAQFSNNSIGLFKCVAGAYTLLGSSYAFTPTVGVTYTLKFALAGNKLVVTLNGGQVIAVTDSTYTAAGLVGVRAAETSTTSGGTHGDNFRVMQSNWSHISGGPAGGVGSGPISTDNVVFDGNSGGGIMTIDQTLNCNSFDFLVDNMGGGTGVGGLALGGQTIYVNGEDANGFAVRLGPGITSCTSSSGQNWNLAASIAPFECLTSGLASIGGLVINAGCYLYGGDQLGAGYQYNGSYHFTQTVSLVGGPLIFNSSQYNPDFIIGTFVSTGTNTRSIDFQSSGGGTLPPLPAIISILNSWTVSGSNITFSNPQLATIIMAAGTTFAGGAKTYNLSIACAGNVTFSNADTITLLEIIAIGTVVANALLTITSLFGYPQGQYKFNNGSAITALYTLTGTTILIAPGYSNTWGSINGLVGTNYGNVYLGSVTAGTQATLSLTGTQVVSWWTFKDINISGTKVVAYRSTDLGDNTNIIFSYGLAKYYVVDVFDYLGNYRGQYNDLIDDPTFSQEVNNPGGQCTIKRGVDPLNFGEGFLVDYNNKLQIKVYSEDAPNGMIFFQGFIGDYTPHIEVSDQYLEIVALGYGDELGQYLAISDPINDQVANSAYTTTVSGPRAAQSFVPANGNIAQIGMSLDFTAPSLSLKLYLDNGSGIPDNTTPLWTTTIPGPLNYLGVPYDNYISPFLSNGVWYGTYSVYPVIPTSGGTYWLVATTSDGSNVNLALGTGSTIASGQTRIYSGGSWGTASATDAQIFADLSGSLNTTFSYSGVNMKTALLDIINNYRIQGGTLNYSSTSIDDPGINFTYAFKTDTVLDAINQIQTQAPAGWYWYVDQATNLIHFHHVATTPKHILTIGVDAEELALQKTMETIVNTVLVTGGPTAGVNLFRNYTNTTSLNRYGRRTQTYNDSQLVSTTAADAIATKIITQYKNPTTRGQSTILAYPSSPAVRGGYFIESIKPGDTFIIQGVANFAMLQFTRIDYSGDELTYEASTILPNVSSDIQDISDAIDQQQTSANPITPTQIAVP